MHSSNGNIRSSRSLCGHCLRGELGVERVGRGWGRANSGEDPVGNELVFGVMPSCWVCGL